MQGGFCLCPSGYRQGLKDHGDPAPARQKSGQGGAGRGEGHAREGRRPAAQLQKPLEEGPYRLQGDAGGLMEG